MFIPSSPLLQVVLDLQTRLSKAEEALQSAEQAANIAANECMELEQVSECMEPEQARLK